MIYWTKSKTLKKFFDDREIEFVSNFASKTKYGDNWYDPDCIWVDDMWVLFESLPLPRLQYRNWYRKSFNWELKEMTEEEFKDVVLLSLL